LISAVDTSVLLDILLGDVNFCEASENAIRNARIMGRVIVCETVIAEISPVFSTSNDLSQFLEDLGIEFVPASYESAELAGIIYRQYLKNKGTSKRVLPDFLVAAHAQSLSATLIARDRGYYRTYFKDLVLLDPVTNT